MPLGLENSALEQRALAADRELGSDSRLQHRVTLDHALARRIEARLIERVRHLPDQPAGGLARQPRVGVERDHVADAGRSDGSAARRWRRSVVSVAPRSSRLNSCSLPRLRSQPIHFPCGFVPDPAAVEQEEALAVGSRAVAEVQARDARARGGEERGVALGALGVRVGPVREQGEAKLAVRTRQVMDPESLDLLLDRLSRGEERGDDDDACEGSPERRRADRGRGASAR